MDAGNTGYLTDMDVRMWLMDHDKALNELIDDLEFSPEMIRTAQTLLVDKWNETPPNVGGYTLYTFPFRYHMLMGTCGLLLSSAANLYRRNKLEYRIPGGGVNRNNRDKDYESAGARLMAEFNDWMRHKKLEINIRRGFGSA